MKNTNNGQLNLTNETDSKILRGKPNTEITESPKNYAKLKKLNTAEK